MLVIHGSTLRIYRAEIRPNRESSCCAGMKEFLAPRYECAKSPACGDGGRGRDVKQISIFLVGLVAAFASIPVAAEDFTAGKTPAQLFRSDCGECHHSPNGLAKDADVRALANFLREHYTTKSETAGALAAYVSGFASAGAARNRGPGAPAPSARDRSRTRSDAESEEAPANPVAVEEPPVRHRRTATITIDGDKKKRRADDDGAVPRPPRRIGTASPKPNAQPPASQPTEGAISRLRAYLSSGMNSQSAIAEAGKTGAPKVRKRRSVTDDAQAGGPKANADAPAAAMPQPAEAPAETPAGER
jgi:hypothetical protein